MILYFAPLEGMTDAVYRRVHRASFSGVAKYFMPFISPSEALSFTVRQRSDLSPTQNAGMPAVPQILAKNADYFLLAASYLHDLGYQEVNLNLGCPSGTVTAKGKGAGMLKDLDALRRFLDEIYAKCAARISIKSRIGYASVSEWPALLELLSQYPVSEWILHPRTCRERYQGQPHREMLDEAIGAAPFPVVYNGDVFTAREGESLAADHPHLERIMLGRGLAANPALAQEMQGGEGLTLEALQAFHDRLYREYLKTWPETAVVGRMHALMAYMLQMVECPGPLRRSLQKSVSADEYTDAVSRLFRECQLKENPHFTPP